MLSPNIENTSRLIKQVEESHRGLGLAMDFTIASALGQLGLILCGLKETGKSTSALANHNYLEQKIFNLKGCATLASFGREEMADTQHRMSNSKVLWTCEDLVHAGEMALSNTLKIASALIDKGEIHYVTSQSYVAIGKCKLSFIGCATPDVLQLLFNTREWQGNYSDRFFRYYILPFEEVDITKGLPSWKLNPPPLFHADPLDVEVDIRLGRYKEAIKLFNSLFSPKRAKLACDSWLAGHAILNGRMKVVKEDIDVLLLSYPNIRIEKWFAKRARPSLPKVYNLDQLIMFAYCLQNLYRLYEANTVVEISEVLDITEQTARELLSSNPYLSPVVLAHNKHAWQLQNKVYRMFIEQKEFVIKCLIN